MKAGEGLKTEGRISEGAYDRMYFLFTGRWTHNWGAYKCGGRGLYRRKFTVPFTFTHKSVTEHFSLVIFLLCCVNGM